MRLSIRQGRGRLSFGFAWVWGRAKGAFCMDESEVLKTAIFAMTHAFDTVLRYIAIRQRVHATRPDVENTLGRWTFVTAVGRAAGVSNHIWHAALR